jgi:hypothetical protein
MIKLSENMARTLLTAAHVGGAYNVAGRQVAAVEALEKRGLVTITKRARNITNLVWFEVTDAGLDAAVELEDAGVQVYGDATSFVRVDARG